MAFFSTTSKPKPPAERIVEVKSPEGLHMRPAMRLVECASEFAAQITVSNDEQSVDAKSIMQITMLAATQGTKLTIRATGADAHEAVETLAVLFDKGMPEE